MKMDAAIEQQALKDDLKRAQEDFNSMQQISLQKQSELQGEVNQLKMSNELREKDIERLNQTLSSEKSQKDLKVQEMQQQLEDTMNELEVAKSSQRSLDLKIKQVEVENKKMGDRLQARYFLEALATECPVSRSPNRWLLMRRSATRAQCPTLKRRPSSPRATWPASRTRWSSRKHSWTRHR